MDIYTTSLKNPSGCNCRSIPVVDTTVKSGNLAFAPRWDMVMGIKQGIVSETEYISEFNKMMEVSQREQPDQWLSLLKMNTVALGCYCAPNTFCHRHLLIELLEDMAMELGIDFNYQGEL